MNIYIGSKSTIFYVTSEYYSLSLLSAKLLKIIPVDYKLWPLKYYMMKTLDTLIENGHIHWPLQGTYDSEVVSTNLSKFICVNFHFRASIKTSLLYQRMGRGWVQFMFFLKQSIILKIT